MKGAPRKLRKSCSLPTCSKTPGECMHCTCDGRCGQHVAGRCGVRREGNGKGCKRDGCARDDSCLHSTRATCCHCRNLVSSSNRSSRKRTRADVDPPVAVGKQLETGDDGAASPTSCDGLNMLPLSSEIFGEFDICDDILLVTKKPRTDDDGETSTSDVELGVGDDNAEVDDDDHDEAFLEPKKSDLLEQTPASATTTGSTSQTMTTTVPARRRALCEYTQYASRRVTCNLVVVVEGMQFNLHKHPMLLESQLLNAKARESVVTTRSAVPFVEFSSFPGGPEAFEALCVYAYTGDLCLTPENAAGLHCAVNFMNMGLAATTMVREYLDTITQQPTADLSQLLPVAQDASALMDKHDALSICAELHLECVDAVARVLPLESSAVKKLLQIPIELFLQVTQEMLATRGPRELIMDTVRQLCVQAELAQMHRDFTENKDASAVSRCLTLLKQSVTPSVPELAQSETLVLAGSSLTTLNSSVVDDDDTLFMKMMCDFEMDPSSDTDTIDGNRTSSFVEALSASSLEPFAFGSRALNLAEAFAV